MGYTILLLQFSSWGLDTFDTSAWVHVDMHLVSITASLLKQTIYNF